MEVKIKDLKKYFFLGTVWRYKLAVAKFVLQMVSILAGIDPIFKLG